MFPLAPIRRPGFCSTQPKTTDGFGPQEAGLARPLLVYYAFKSSMFAHQGMCQSCAAKLDLRQCVVHSEPHTHIVYQSGSPSSASPPPSSLELSKEVESSEEESEAEQDIQVQADSAEYVLENSSVDDVTEATVAQFLDETPGMSWSLESSSSTNLSDIQPHVELSKFLSRPVVS